MMGGVGSGRRNGGGPSQKKIDAARLELGRMAGRANREGAVECTCSTETLRLVLYGIVDAMAECSALTHDVERSMTRENRYLNALMEIAGGGGPAAEIAAKALYGPSGTPNSPASAIEARSDATPKSGAAEGESAATEGGDAQEGVVRDHE